MARWFNIGGPCNAANHYMLPATERFPEVASLIRKQQYFVVHAPRQCGKTTGFLALANEINAKGDAVAFYCSLETAQEFPDPAVGLPLVYRCICGDARRTKLFPNCAPIAEDAVIPSAESILSDGIKNLLSSLAESAGKPLVIFFDEADCLSAGTLVTFLRQLRNGRISCASPGTFPSTVALIGMRDIRDYKAKVRPDSETLGSASPFNVVTEAMTLRSFTEEELRALYRQHTDETGQAFEEEALKLAWEFSQGQPYLVNALARWCVEEIHKDDYTRPVTGAEMAEAKKIVRERPGYLHSIWKRSRHPCVNRIVEGMKSGHPEMISSEMFRSAEGFGILQKNEGGTIVYANKIVEEALSVYRTGELSCLA